MTISTISSVLSLVFMVLVLTDGQGPPTRTPRPTRTPPTRPTTTPKLPSRRGIVLTVMKSYYTTRDSAQIRSIPAIPYYDPWDGLVPGIKFSDPDIHFLSADVDFQSKNLYLYDYYLKSIAIGNQYNPDLKLDNMTFEFMHAGVSQATVQVAYDWHSRTLYWVDPGFGWIMAAPGDPARINDDLYKIIVQDNMDKPDGLAVDPYEGLLFWSDNGKTKKIESVTLFGEDRKTIVTRNLKSPRALEADHLTQRIFWLDNKKEEIESVKYDGTDRRTVRRIAASSLFDIAIYQEMAIISDISDGRIYFLNKTSGASMYSTIRIGSETTYGIAVYSEDNQPGKELRDDCPALGCPQLCLTGNKKKNNGAPKCVCTEGYEYNAQNKTCIETAGSYHRAVILMTNTDVCYGDLRSLASYSYNATCVFTTTKPEIMYQQGTTTPPPRTPVPTTSFRTRSTTTTPRPPSTTPFPAETILYMDMDMEERILYFASLQNIYSRSIDQRTYANMKTRVTATNLNISGLAYDWIDRYNLYYSTTQGYIYVKNVKDTSVRRIFQSPTSGVVENLVLLPHERQLAWTSFIGGVASKIEIANISSSNTGNANVATLVGGRAEIRSLTYDQHFKTFYWIESNYVYKYNRDRDQPEVIYSDTGNNAFHLQLYKNSLIVAETYTNSTLTHFKTIDLTSTDAIKKVTAEGTILNVPGVTHFKILDTELQPQEESFCKKNNGNCEQLCLTTHDGKGNMQKTCACGYGFYLQDDGRSCKSASKSGVDFLLVADITNDQINQVVLDTGNFHALSSNRPGKPKALVYDRLRERVIFSLEAEDKVYAASLDEEGSEILLELDFFTIPNRFAIDETTGNIYFTSSYYDYIGVITPHKTYIELTVDELFLADVSSIALHPGKGYMYYAVHDYSYSYIGRANMDGTSSQHLIQSDNTTKIRWPDGLAIDYDGGYLYWSDRYYDFISRCDLDGRQCVKIYEDPMADINDLATEGTFLYFSTQGKGLFKIALGSNPVTATKMGTETEMGRLGSVSLYRKYVSPQPVADGCSANGGKGPCSTICLPKPYGKYTCRCDTGVLLKSDNRTCSDVFQCNATVGNAQAPPSCSRLADTSCDLECKPGFIKIFPTSNMTTFCSKVGWDFGKELCKAAVCPLTIDKVDFVDSCTGKIDETCSYTCARGFTPTMRSVRCRREAVWDIGDDEFCTETRCDLDGIENGAFKATCQGKINVACDYECDSYYTPSLSPPTMICQSSGLWNRNVTTACTSIACPNNITDGIINNNCVGRSVGTNCGFSCNPGFVKQVDEVVCTGVGAWSPRNPCKHMPCPVSIKNGLFVGSCSGEYGTTCQFSCNNPYYKTAINTNSLRCGENGNWLHGNAQVNTNVLCTEILCSQGIQNARLSNNCDRKVLSKCDFTCNSGYEKSIGVTKATCMETGSWTTNDMTACVESCGDNKFRCDSGQCITKDKECNNVKDCDDGSDEGSRCVSCPSFIPNGQLVSCDYTVGRNCNYTCSTNYHKVDDTVVCTLGGEWHIKTPCEADVCPGKWKCNSGQCIPKEKECDGTPDCADKSDEDEHCAVTCPATIPLGTLLNCDRKVGQRCNFTCKTGYSKQNDDLICLRSGSWSIAKPCLVTTCPRTVPNGKISPECRRPIVGDSCQVVCDNGFKLSDQKSVNCLQSGKWSVSDDLCTAIKVKPQPQTSSPNTGVVVGVVIGVLVLLIIVAAVVAFLLYKRRLLPGRFRSRSPSAKYSTSDIAIENPGYMNANINVTDDSRQENPYDNPIEYQPGLSNFTNGPDVSGGYVNPMYKAKANEEPLPEQGDIAIHQDDVVLTTDSWQKEQLKGPEA